MTTIIRGVFRNLSRGGLKFVFLPGGGGGLSTRWGMKTPEINRFHWSRGGLAPIAPTPEYASGNNNDIFQENTDQTNIFIMSIKNFSA